ncbi:hypothetical protein LLG88_13635 [bacterium]|nr:hypothetical protein [bacterium]
MTLRETCCQFGAQVPPLSHNGVPCDGALVLWAFAAVESSYGRDRGVPRHERAYAPGGVMYRQSAAVRDLYARFGPGAACSYGTWQMMFPTARELGFNGPPEALKDDAVLAPLVCRFLVRSQGGTLENAADAYNSGSWRDTCVPLDYVAKIVRAYETGWDSSATPERAS